jgi:hypothetical protein
MIHSEIAAKRDLWSVLVEYVERREKAASQAGFGLSGAVRAVVILAAAAKFPVRRADLAGAFCRRRG